MTGTAIAGIEAAKTTTSVMNRPIRRVLTGMRTSVAVRTIEAEKPTMEPHALDNLGILISHKADFTRSFVLSSIFSHQPWFAASFLWPVRLLGVSQFAEMSFRTARDVCH
jgi:hypothetical protein